MADTTNDNPEETETKQSGLGLFTAIGLFFIAAVAGVAVPYFVPNLVATEATQDNSERMDNQEYSPDGMTYVSFGEVTVNLDEGRMNRYLRLKMALQVEASEEVLIQKLVEEKQLILRNWLLSHLSDKTLDEIRGKAGQNMLRREIRNHFNTTLFTDGRDHIYDILFEEFNVQ